MATLAEIKHAAASAGMTLIGIEVGSGTDFNGVFTAMLRERPDALLVSNDPLHQLHIDWIITFLAQHRLPAMCTASCKAPIPLTCQSSCRRSSISPST